MLVVMRFWWTKRWRQRAPVHEATNPSNVSSPKGRTALVERHVDPGSTYIVSATLTKEDGTPVLPCVLQGYNVSVSEHKLDHARQNFGDVFI